MLSAAAECRGETLKRGKKRVLMKEETKYKDITTTVHYWELLREFTQDSSF